MAKTPDIAWEKTEKHLESKAGKIAKGLHSQGTIGNYRDINLVTLFWINHIRKDKEDKDFSTLSSGVTY